MGDGLVQARGLRKSFGGFEAVRGVDVDVAPGEIFGFLGPNGAGKSSTMRMIACVSPRSGGELSVKLQPTHKIIDRIMGYAGNPNLVLVNHMAVPTVHTSLIT